MLIESYATPADQPIQFSTKFDLVTNEKTSNALGLTVPSDLLLDADLIEDAPK